MDSYSGLFYKYVCDVISTTSSMISTSVTSSSIFKKDCDMMSTKSRMRSSSISIGLSMSPLRMIHEDIGWEFMNNELVNGWVTR